MKKSGGSYQDLDGARQDRYRCVVKEALSEFLLRKAYIHWFEWVPLRQTKRQRSRDQNTVPPRFEVVSLPVGAANQLRCEGGFRAADPYSANVPLFEVVFVCSVDLGNRCIKPVEMAPYNGARLVHRTGLQGLGNPLMIRQNRCHFVRFVEAEHA